MQHNFNSRLGVMYIVNAPKSISIPWAMIKPFSNFFYFIIQYKTVESDTR